MTDDRELSLSVWIHNPRKIFAEHVQGRKLVYLDQNAWIELRDAKSPEAVRCLEVCRESVEHRQVIFPLAFPIVTEAIEIGDLETRLRHADLLDSLSTGITFRAPPVLFGLEAQNAYLWFYKGEDRQLSREEVFSYTIEFVGNHIVEFPPGFPPEAVSQYVAHTANDERMRSVRFVATQRDWKAGHAPMNEAYVRGMRNLRQRRPSQPRLPKKQTFARALLTERISLLKNFVAPAFTKSLIEEVGVDKLSEASRGYLAAKGEGGKKRIGQIFARMPMLDQHARLFALDAIEVARKPQAQDLFDIDHGTVPPIYSDAFVTLDNRLADLVRNAARGSAEIITSLSGLESWLVRDIERS